MQDDESAISHTRLAYLPALDGVRAFAVVAVMLFHGGIPHMAGGFMGVDAFFVLSGFLITSLLVGEWRQTLTIRLGAFWARRARRLLPALLLMLLFVAFFASVIVPKGTYGALRLDALSTLLYVSNWHFILVNSNYFNETAASSPLLHTWSLAVEEQFYLIWPLVVLGVMHFTKEPAGPVRAVLSRRPSARPCGCTSSTTAASTPTGPTSARTPGRSACSSGARWPSASCSLAQRQPRAGPAGQGGAVAAGKARRARCVRRPRRSSARVARRRHLGAHDVDVGVPVLGRVLPHRPGGRRASSSPSVAAPRSIVPRFLSLTPIRYVGRISYGLYIWHWPIFIWLNHARTGLLGWQLFAVRVAGHLRRVGGVVPPRRAPDPHGHLRPPVAGLAGRARRGRRGAGRPGRGDHGDHRRGQHGSRAGIGTTGATTTTTTTVPGAPPTAQPVRVLLFGDSVALTLGLGLADHDRAGQVRLRALRQGHPRLRRGERARGPAAGAARRHAARRATGRRYVAGRARGRPALALPVAGGHGRGQAERRRAPGRALGGGRPPVPGAVDQHLEPDVRRLREAAAGPGVASWSPPPGARMVFLTAPCTDEGEQPDGAPWPEDNPQRICGLQPAGARGGGAAPADRLGRRPLRGGLPGRAATPPRSTGSTDPAHRRRPLHHRRRGSTWRPSSCRRSWRPAGRRRQRPRRAAAVSRRVTPVCGFTFCGVVPLPPPGGALRVDVRVGVGHDALRLERGDEVALVDGGDLRDGRHQRVPRAVVGVGLRPPAAGPARSCCSACFCRAAPRWRAACRRACERR